MAEPIQRVRIFIASSADLAEHRLQFRLHLGVLNKRWCEDGLLLEAVHWENFVDAMSKTGLQDEYNRALAQCDIFVMLYSTKVGKYTAEEFEAAWARFSKSGQPLMYVYKHEAAVDPDDLPAEHFASLQRFKARLAELKHFKTDYADAPDLLLKVGEQLEKLRAERRFVPKPGEDSPPPPPPGTSLTPYLTRRAEHWRSGAAGQLDRRFVNLTLMIDHGLEHDGPRREEEGRYELLSELLAERPDVGAWVLVGAPGSGKSTVLQHHEMSTAAAALVAREDAASTPEICIWHRLSEYDADKSPPPAEWLTLPARWPQQLAPLDSLRGLARVRFLLDGLNEIKAPSRARQLDAIDRWTEWAAAEAARGDGLAPIFSVRTLDQSPLSTSGFEVRQIVLAPWNPQQIEQYCERKLGTGNALWPTIEADEGLLKLSELPFNLWAQCELFRTLGRAARDRAELMGGLFWQMLSKRVNDKPMKERGLLGDADLKMIASGEWKQRLRALPDRHGCLVPWLDDAMQRLHRRGRQVSVTQTELLAELQPKPGWATPEQWLYAVRSLKLIDDEGGYDEFSTEPLLRCSHQLWQEFFAARGIRDWAANSPSRLPDFSPPALPSLDNTVAKLGVQEPLPGPDPTHWEEPVKLAVQLVKDPKPWMDLLREQNLALAGRAAVACRARLEAATLDSLRQALLARSRDPATDLRLRIEAGLILGELGDPRYEERHGSHGRYLWPRQWVMVPAGIYRIGDGDAPYDSEGPETEVRLSAFEMAFAPVTNAEYRCFIEAGGYQDERWWQGETALKWLKEGVRNEAEIQAWRTNFADIRADCEGWMRVRPGLTEATREQLREMSRQAEAEHETVLNDWYGAKKFDLPQEWENPVFNAPSQPIVGVCQFEAQAYANWLHAQCGDQVRLPTEAEWEAAARGAHRRRWPWSEQDPERWQLNADPVHLRRTSPVGTFMQADTPEGLTDLSGNVQEWTTSAFTERLDADSLNSEAPEGLARRAVRGGSWGSAPRSAAVRRSAAGARPTSASTTWGSVWW